MNYKLNEIVLVADSFTHSEESINFYSTTLEKPSIEYTNDVYNALKLYAKKVKICNSPNDLNKYLLNNTVDLVMTIYGGEISRNRLALVPAICESMDVKYLGADVYNRIICQDKHLAKVFAKKFNVLSAMSILLHTKDDLYLINSLNFPLYRTLT
jgi:D-alanine-D-alanine ligase